MKTICFATNNENKLSEIREILAGQYTVISLKELGCEDELPENQETLEGNSLEKAEYIYQNFNQPVFADDTGLEVEALNGEPGVYSARYAGPQRSANDNNSKLLTALDKLTNRKAQFRTVITFIDGEVEEQFEGVVKGLISTEIKGSDGFGYDPIFIPENHSRTFSEMSSLEKNEISHRKRAIEKLVDFLARQP